MLEENTIELTNPCEPEDVTIESIYPYHMLQGLPMVEFKLSDFDRLIPEFSGKSDEINKFISCCELYHDSLRQADKGEIMKYIRSKLSGEAFIFYECNEDKTWLQFKSLIFDKFSEKKTLIHLQSEVSRVTQGN